MAKSLLCSRCFEDQGLKVDADKIGTDDNAPCPNCGARDGRKLDAPGIEALAHRFFVRGTVHRVTYGAAPILQFNEQHAGADEIELSEPLRKDVRLISRAINIGLFRYAPRLWMVGEIEPLKALQSASERQGPIGRMLTEYPTRELKARGLRAPALTIADGHLGIWSALAQIYPTSAEQRCWNHKLRNVLDVVPEKHQGAVKADLQAIANAETQASCERHRAAFRRAYSRVYPKAVERLDRDWARMITYYAFPQPHWRHLRTTNVIESPFHAVRLRTTAAKRFKRVESATALIWKLLLVAEQQFRKLNAPHLCREVFAGIEYRDGMRVTPSPARERHAA